MRGLTVIGIGLVLTAGCVSRSNRGTTDARTDRSGGDAITDTGAPPDAADAADAPADHPPADGTAADAPEGGPPDTPQDTATADTATSDTATADTATADTAPSDTVPADAAAPDGARSDATDAPGDSGNADARPPDPCASNAPLSTVGCNGEPPGPAAPDTFGGRCSFTDASAAGTCINTKHVCAEGMCVLLCEPTRVTEVSTGGCPTGSRCWNTGLLAFCFPDCRAAADCATARCDSGRGICRGP